MLIDAHVHLFPDRLAQAIRRWFDAHAWDIQHRVGVDEALQTLRDGGIDACVVLPYAHKPGIADALNDFTLELAKQHPMVWPCCTVFPGEDGNERRLDEALSGPFRGVKIHCHVMKIAPDDPALDVVWRASARWRKPVTIHCGPEPSLPGYGVDTHDVSGAARLRKALDRHPGAIAIVPHLGVDETGQFEAMLAEYPGLYLDTTMACTGYFPYEPSPEIIRRHPSRILYGTDFPNLPYAWDRELKALKSLKLPPADEALVLGGNAARLFGQ